LEVTFIEVFFSQGWENPGKIPSHPQKYACSHIYAKIQGRYACDTLEMPLWYNKGCEFCEQPLTNFRPPRALRLISPLLRAWKNNVEKLVVKKKFGGRSSGSYKHSAIANKS